MPTVKLTDSAGFSLDVTPDNKSGIAKYFKTPVALQFVDAAVRIQDAELASYPVDSIRTGLQLANDVEIGPPGRTEMTLSGRIGLSAGVTVYRTEGEGLLGRGLMESPKVGTGQAYLRFDIRPTIGAGLASGRGDLTFGFQASSEAAFSYYRPFDISAGTVRFFSALERTVAEFTIPADLEDLQQMPEGAMATAEGDSDLQFSGGFAMGTSLNPLVNFNLPVVRQAVKVGPSASIALNAQLTLTSGSQLRIEKLGANRIRMGLYKIDSRNAEIGVKASAGLTTTVGNTDFAAALAKAITGGAATDDLFTEAGLTEGERAMISNVVQSSVARSLSLSLEARFGALRRGEAAFLLEADLEKIQQPENLAARQALQHALDGDFRLVTAQGAEDTLALGGLRLLRSIFKDTEENRSSLKINLVGIYNYFSIAKLVAEREVLTDEVTGEVVITDKATAERIRGALKPLAAETEKLRQLYFESFLMTAVYRGSERTGLLASPELRSQQRYFEFQRRTKRQPMKDNLDVPLALGFLSRSDQQELLGEQPEFGKSALLAEVGYDGKILRSLFLGGDGQPRSRDDFEQAGRQALKLLVEGDSDQAYRLTLLTHWDDLERAGSAQAAAALTPHLTPIQREVVHSDYLTVVFWAKSMEKLAQRLHDVDEFFESGHAPIGDRFEKLSGDLQDSIAQVAKKTREKFGDPWGLVAMDLLAGRSGDAKVRVMCAEFTRDYSGTREPAPEPAPAEARAAVSG